MNIFYLHTHPLMAARMHCDKHCVKMILESGQMLSTAYRMAHQYKKVDGKYIFIPLNDNYDNLYKMAHVNHPSTKWARQSLENYVWLYNLFTALCDEYTYRYGKIHMTDTKLRVLLKQPPQFLESEGFTPPPQCMPDEYKNQDTVKAYRQYYLGEKKDFLNYTKREKPEWMKNDR